MGARIRRVIETRLREISDMIEKKESRRIRAEIRRVLLEVWDPIGVKDVPQAQDEYDCCLYEVFRLLTAGGSDDQITDFLWKQGTEHMGLSLNGEQMHPTVAGLRGIQISSER
jgi:hypothetical protein